MLICSLLGVKSVPGNPTYTLKVGVSCNARVLKKYFRDVMSKEYFRGGTPASTHKLAAGDDLKASVHALRHSFWMGLRRLSALVPGIPYT